MGCAATRSELLMVRYWWQVFKIAFKNAWIFSSLGKLALQLPIAAGLVAIGTTLGLPVPNGELQSLLWFAIPTALVLILVRLVWEMIRVPSQLSADLQARIAQYESSKPRKPNKKDVDLYERILRLLPSDLMTFYKAQLFLAAFKREYSEPLFQFVDAWNTPEHESVDAEMEAARRRLYDSASALGQMIARYTVPTGVGMRSVKPDYLPPGPTPDRVRQEAKAINNLCPAFVESHEQFVRIGRRKLYA